MSSKRYCLVNERGERIKPNLITCQSDYVSYSSKDYASGLRVNGITLGLKSYASSGFRMTTDYIYGRIVIAFVWKLVVRPTIGSTNGSFMTNPRLAKIFLMKDGDIMNPYIGDNFIEQYVDQINKNIKGMMYESDYFEIDYLRFLANNRIIESSNQMLKELYEYADKGKLFQDNKLIPKPLIKIESKITPE